MKDQNWFVKLLSLIGITLDFSWSDDDTPEFEDVLRAMKKITRMRRKIDTLISSLNGRIQALGLNPVGVPVGFLDADRLRYIRTDDFTWKLIWSPGDTAYVLGFIPGTEGHHQSLMTFSCVMSKPNADSISYRDVPAVYGGLQVLLNDLLKNLPQLRKDVNDLLEVTDQ